VSCLFGCVGLVCAYLRDRKVQEGLLWGGGLQKGPKGTVIANRGKPMTKQDIRTRVDLCKGMY
jgi:hypothetical protein